MRPGARSLLVINSRMEPGIVGVTVDREQIENERLRHAITGISRVVPVTPTAVNIVRDLRKQGRLTGEPDYLIHHLPALLAAIDELEAKVAEQDHIIRNSGRIKHVLELEAMRDRVLALHQKVRSQSLCGPGDFCVEDGRSSPCETVRALEP